MNKILVCSIWIILMIPKFSWTQSLFVPLGINGVGSSTTDVGIGTSSPSNIQGWGKVLDVRGSGHSKILVTNFTNDLKVGVFNHTSWYGGGGFVGTESNHNLFFLTDYSVKMSILTNGFVGMATTNPRTFLDVGDFSANTLKSVLARLPEGNDSGEGTYLGIRSYHTQPENGENCCSVKSFAIEHKFYGQTNSSINFYRGGGILGGFITFCTTDNVERMRIDQLGNVVIGKTTQSNPLYKLDVAGKVRADEITVNTNGADFVFENGYNLRPLHEVESFIKANKHLPGIAPAAEMQTNGASIGEMNTKLLQKVEELTLYLINQNKRIDQLFKENRILRRKVEQSNIVKTRKK